MVYKPSIRIKDLNREIVSAVIRRKYGIEIMFEARNAYWSQRQVTDVEEILGSINRNLLND